MRSPGRIIAFARRVPRGVRGIRRRAVWRRRPGGSPDAGPQTVARSTPTAAERGRRGGDINEDRLTVVLADSLAQDPAAPPPAPPEPDVHGAALSTWRTWLTRLFRCASWRGCGELHLTRAKDGPRGRMDAAETAAPKDAAAGPSARHSIATKRRGPLEPALLFVTIPDTGPARASSHSISVPSRARPAPCAVPLILLGPGGDFMRAWPPHPSEATECRRPPS